MSDRSMPPDSEVVLEIGHKSGYRPVTPLGPPPAGEPLFSQYPSQPEAASINHAQTEATPVQPKGSAQQQTP